MATSSLGPGSTSLPAQAYHVPPIVSKIPPGTFHPGTPITVGAHKCTVERYLTEGGFAHVYLVRLAVPVNGSELAVLKRVAVPDKEALTNMRTEVETMKRLKGHRHIVTYIDSHASHLKGGGYEVFLLMEYCSGGGLIDFMNTRLQNRLTEPEVLHIFNDVAEGVACMHYLQPPLLHRDLKVENVLIASSRRFVLCDFGSSAPPRQAGTTVAECRLMEEEIQKHTTLQYRSPEMIDVYRKLPIDEKSDIWALGVLLYKLCYYTTPFEEGGQLAILNASFKFPSYPVFSDRLKLLIASMLRESPQLRPNIYQVLREVCLIRGKEVPITDIYSRPTAAMSAEAQLPLPPGNIAPSVIAYQTPTTQPAQAIPEIVPMRRGRPIKNSNSSSTSAPPTRAVSSDPWAVLDNNSGAATIAQDELSTRFPSVEQFSLLHDSGNKFDFKEFSHVSETRTKDLSTRVMEKLADDAFVRPTQRMDQKMQESKYKSEDSVAKPQGTLHESAPNKPQMISQGTMTSPTNSPCPSPDKHKHKRLAASSQSHSTLLNHRDSEQPVSPGATQAKVQQPVILEAHPSSSYLAPKTTSTRTSLELQCTPAASDLAYVNLTRSKSANSKPRPSSVYIESNLEFLRDLDSPGTLATPSTLGLTNSSLGVHPSLTGQSTASQRSDHIESNVEFLRAMENESDMAKGCSKADKRFPSGSSFVGKHVKRASMPSISLSTTKNLLAGKFGEAFRKFETNSGTDLRDRSSSPSNDNRLIPETSGSGQNSETSEDDIPHSWDYGAEDLSPETKRELEKRLLAQEEKRVAAAAAEYKKRVTNQPPGVSHSKLRHGSPSRASLIQNKVKALLSENRAPAPRAAEGYGPYTDEFNSSQQDRERQAKLDNPSSYKQQSQNAHTEPSLASIRPTPNGIVIPSAPLRTNSKLTNNAQPLQNSPTKIHPPNPPPKPKNLRTGTDIGINVAKPNNSTISPTLLHTRSKEKLYSSAANSRPSSSNAKDGTDLFNHDGADDWQRTFAQKYPSLSGLELVETVVGSDTGVNSNTEFGGRKK